VQSSDSQPVPALAGHSVTVINNDDVVIIIGGVTSSHQFSQSVYIVDRSADELVWTRLVNITGAQPRGQFNLSVAHYEHL